MKNDRIGKPHVIVTMTLPQAQRLLARAGSDRVLAKLIMAAIDRQRDRVAAQAQKKERRPEGRRTKEGMRTKYVHSTVDRLSDS